MLKWRDLIFNRGFIYFLFSIIAPFWACIFLLNEINNLDFLEGSAPSIVFETKEKDLSLVFFGDAMLDRNVRKLMDVEGVDAPFIKIKPFVEEHDIGVLNLEGVITDNESITIKDNKILRFTFDPSVVKAIKDAGFDIVSQSNNHTNDFGRVGLETSKKYLEGGSVNAFGDFFNESEPLYINKNNQKIAFVGFNEFSYNNFNKVESDIYSAKMAGYFVVVFAHFGAEYERFPNAFQKTKARGWIDAGADMVIGAHPHVIEPIEEYKGKPIFYSLGNFIFDQYFSKETQEGIAVSLSINNKSFSFKITPFDILRSKPTLSENNKEILLSLSRDSEVSSEWRESIASMRYISVQR